MTLVGATAIYVQTRVDNIHRLDLATVLDEPGSGGAAPTNILIVGSDKRAGVEGARADTLIVLRVNPVTNRVQRALDPARPLPACTRRGPL